MAVAAHGVCRLRSRRGTRASESRVPSAASVRVPIAAYVVFFSDARHSSSSSVTVLPV